MENQDRYQALLVIVTGFLVLSFLIKDEYAPYLLYAAVGVGVLGLMFPFVRDGIVWAWFKLAEGLGYINSRILLGAVFFVVLFPFAMLFRLTTKNPLRLKYPGDSVFDERNHQYEKKDLENIW